MRLSLNGGGFEGVDYPAGVQSVDDNIGLRMKAALFGYDVADVHARKKNGNIEDLFTDDSGLLSFLGAGNGKQYKIVSAPIRAVNNANYWEVIADATHKPVGIDSLTVTDTYLQINYPNLQAVGIVGFLAVVDDGLSALRVFCGASVEKDSAKVYFQNSTQISGIISYNGSAWVCDTSAFTIDSYTAGLLTLSHAAVSSGAPDVSVLRKSANRLPSLPASGQGYDSTHLYLQFYDNAGALLTVPDTSMKAYVNRGWSAASIVLNPKTYTNFNGNNIWVFGVFEVD